MKWREVSMQYKYRWWYVLVIILVGIAIVFFFVVVPCIDDLHTMQASEQKLAVDLLAQKQAVAKFHEQSIGKNKQAYSLEEMFARMYASGLSVQEVSVTARRSFYFASIEVVHVVAAGDVAALSAFLFPVLPSKLGVIVEDFSYRVSPSRQMIVTMNLVDWQSDIELAGMTRLAYSAEHLPFCVSDAELPHLSRTEEILAVPLDQINMVGRLQQANRVVALVSTPMGIFFDVEQGSILGKERGRVKTINQDRIVIVVRGQERIIKMRDKQHET
jgi:hypothetical protein